MFVVLLVAVVEVLDDVVVVFELRYHYLSRSTIERKTTCWFCTLDNRHVLQLRV